MIHVDIVACISMWQICYLCRILCALKCIIMQQFIFDSFAHSFASFCLFRFALCFYFHLGCGIKSRLGKWEYRIETLFRQYLFNPDEQNYGRIKAKKNTRNMLSSDDDENEFQIQIQFKWFYSLFSIIIVCNRISFPTQASQLYTHISNLLAQSRKPKANPYTDTHTYDDIICYNEFNLNALKSVCFVS